MRLSALDKSPKVLANMSSGKSSSQPIEITDLKLNTKTRYHDIRAGAKALNLDKRCF